MDSPKEVKKEKDKTSNNAGYTFRIRRSSLPFEIVDLTTDDDERQPLTFLPNFGTPISTTTSRNNDETDMEAVTPISSSSSNVGQTPPGLRRVVKSNKSDGTPEPKYSPPSSSDTTQPSMETMFLPGQDSRANNQIVSNEENENSDDGRDDKAIINRLMSKPLNGKTQFSRHHGAKKFVDTTGSFPKGSLGFSHFKSYKAALECINTVIGKKEKAHFSVQSSGRDSSGILSKVARCCTNGKRNLCERKVKMVELRPEDWVVILGSNKHTCNCKKHSRGIGSTKGERSSKRTKTSDDQISTGSKVGGRKTTTRGSVENGTKKAPPSVNTSAAIASLPAGVEAQVTSIAQWIEKDVFKGILPNVATSYAKAFIEHGLFSPDMIVEYVSKDVFNQEGPLKDAVSDNHKMWFMVYVDKLKQAQRKQASNP